ncbi:protein kinase domain-containing protein [Streptomyces sp. NPDC054841]
MDGSGAEPLEPGDPGRIGSFTLLGVLGSGGMGRVYLGTTSGHYAAIKRVLPALAEDKDFLRHFGHELDNLARLPAGVSARMLASDRTAQPPWFATEYIPGITLSEAVRLHGGPLPPDALWRLLRDAASGLTAVHATEIVHRDLKPSNVMLTLDGVTLIDFGVARAADQSRLTRTGMAIGTPAYMAPEQAVMDRQLTGAADVFALGSLLLYAANRRPPFGDGSGPDLLYRIVHTDPDLGQLPEADPELSAVVESCLAKDPSARPTAAELVDLARDHVPAATTSPWPIAVTDRITERAAFAANPPVVPVAPTAEENAPESPAPVFPDAVKPEAPPADTAAPATRKPLERRTRVMLFALPVVVITGTTLTIALSPYDILPKSAGPGASTPTATVSPSESAAGGRSPNPTAPSSRPPGSKPGASGAPPSASGAPGNGGTGDGAGTGTGTGTGTGSGNGSSGSTDSGGTGTSGGSNNSVGGSGGSGGDLPPAPSGTYLLRNASDSRCLAESSSTYGGADVTAQVCGEPAHNGATNYYKWTYSAISSTTFRLVSEGVGKCLVSRGYAGLAIETCNGSEAQSWQIRNKTSKGHTLENTAEKRCLMMSGFSMGTTACNSSETAQLWRNS